jgi:hypothetical protein
MSEPLFVVYRHLAVAGAFGQIWLRDSAPFAVTLERTYEDSGPPQTKIRPGQWRCQRRRYNRGGYDTWEILIPGHSAILFHKGNKELHSDGCVLLGESLFDFNPAEGLQDPGVADSNGAFKEFMGLTSGLDQFEVRFINT